MMTLNHSEQLKTNWTDKLSHLAALPVVSVQHVFCCHCTLRVMCKHEMHGMLAVPIIFGKSAWGSVLYLPAQPGISWFCSIVSSIEGCGSVIEQAGKQL